MFAQQIYHLCAAPSKAVVDVMHSKLAVDSSTLGICFMASLCALLPLEISQLSFAILGAVLYVLLQRRETSSTKKQKKLPQFPTNSDYCRAIPYAAKSNLLSDHPVCSKNTCARIAEAPQSPDIRKVSAQPIAAPTFQSQNWEGEIQELLAQITPAASVQEVVNNLAHAIQHIAKQIIPEVDVIGFSSGNLIAGKAFGVAVPEVDIIARASPQILYARLNGRKPNGDGLDVHKVHKSAIRAFTDRLVSVGGFKFRRSAFRCQEPKVTLLAPKILGLFMESVPIDFSVNAVTPLYNAALLAECGQIDQRAKELIWIVKRWAKDRGICHAAKGHLSPYLWSLLSIYFLQVGVKEEGPLLPPIGQFTMQPGLVVQSSIGEKTSMNAVTFEWAPTSFEQTKSVGELFKEFVHFFATQFDYQREAVSVRLGQRAPASLKLPVCMIVEKGFSASQVGLNIEDPFQASHNLGDCMTALSFSRFRQELSRAATLCANGASLSELLEPWVPGDELKCDADEQRNASVEAATAHVSVPLWRRQM